MNFKEIIKSKIKTDIDKELVSLLRSSWDHDEFVLGCLVFLEEQKQRGKLLNLIKDNNITDSDDIQEAIGYIEEGLEPEFV